MLKLINRNTGVIEKEINLGRHHPIDDFMFQGDSRRILIDGGAVVSLDLDSENQTEFAPKPSRSYRRRMCVSNDGTWLLMTESELARRSRTVASRHC